MLACSQTKGARVTRKTTFIAEIGENFFGNLDLAKGLLECAADAGADIVKFQSYRGADLAPNDPDHAWFNAVALSDKVHFDLRDLAQKKGARFLSSPFTVERAQFLVEQLGLQEIKIASGKMHNSKMLQYLKSKRDVVKTIYISTGTATLDEVRTAVNHLDGIERVVILHCISSYPCPDGDANLRVISTLKREFPDHEIGYSDHTTGMDACIAAVVLGATVLEKHFTYNQQMPGADHLGGITPQDLRILLMRIAHIEQMLGSGMRVPTAQEKQITPLLRDRFGD